MIYISYLDVGDLHSEEEVFPFYVRFNWNLSSDGEFSIFDAIRRPYFGLFLGVL